MTPEEIAKAAFEKFGVDHGRHRQPDPQVHGRPSSASDYVALYRAAVAVAQFTSTGSAPPEPRPVESAGIRPGEVTAIRAWRVKDGKLTSVAVIDAVWERDAPMVGDPHNRRLGVHAFKQMGDLTDYLKMCQMNWQMFGPAIVAMRIGAIIETLDDPIHVIGAVDLWGEIIEHERGYRAQFGQISRLDRIFEGGNDDLLAQLRVDYRV